MPVYEYRCTQCQHLFERYLAVGEAAPECPQCGQPSRKVFASVGLIFKGSGFHSTDYRKRSRNGEGEGAGPSPKTEPSAEPGTRAASTPSGPTSEKS